MSGTAVLDVDMTFSDGESDMNSDYAVFSNEPSDGSSETSLSDNDHDSDSDSESDANDDSDLGDCLFEDEVLHPPEYYLAEAENLDASQLRQQRYSPRTREKLEKTRHYWDR